MSDDYDSSDDDIPLWTSGYLYEPEYTEEELLQRETERAERERQAMQMAEQEPPEEDREVRPAESKKPSCQGSKMSGRPGTLVSDWSEGDVSSWLGEEGLGELVGVFQANNIDGAELIRLNKEILTTELGIDSVGLRGRVLRKLEELRAEPSSSEAPDEFLCPITREAMRDPVIAADGYSYEREAMESWISGKNRSSPMTNLPLATTVLTPNRSLKMAIGRWKSTQ